MHFLQPLSIFKLPTWKIRFAKFKMKFTYTVAFLAAVAGTQAAAVLGRDTSAIAARSAYGQIGLYFDPQQQGISTILDVNGT